MASAFNLTAVLNFAGPTGLSKVVKKAKAELSALDGSITLRLNKATQRQVTALNKELQAVDKTLTSIAAKSAAAAASLGSMGKSASAAATGLAKTSSAAKAAATGVKATGDAAKEATTFMFELGKAGGLALKRFAGFSIATGLVFGFVRAISSAASEAINFERQLVKIAQVGDRSIGSLSSLTKEITRLSTTFGTSSASLLEVSRSLAQTGLSARDTKVALEALAKSDLAPTFGQIKQTTEGAIAAMRQFRIGAQDLEKVLGSINAVAGKFAVEAEDIIAAVRRTGGVFAAASGDVETFTNSFKLEKLQEFIALFTSVRATTRESAETIATGLRTVFTRIQRGSTIVHLKELGIQLQDTEGNFVGAFKAVERLSDGLKNLDPRSAKFNQLVEELGGFRQVGKVIPLIQRFGDAQKALKVAQQGQDSLATDAAKAQKTLAVQIAQTREEFSALIRDLTNTSSFKTIATIVLTTAKSLITLAGAVKPVLPLLTAFAAIKVASAASQFGKGFFGGLREGSGGAGGAKSLGSATAKAATGGGSAAISANTTMVKANTTALINLTNVIKSSKKFSGGGKVLGFNTGGVVPGQGSSDTVRADLTPGEFVIRKKVAEGIGHENLQRLNRGGSAKFNLTTRGRSPGNVGRKKQALMQKIEQAEEKASLTEEEREMLVSNRARLREINKSRTSRFSKKFGYNKGGRVRFADGDSTSRRMKGAPPNYINLEEAKKALAAGRKLFTGSGISDNIQRLSEADLIQLAGSDEYLNATNAEPKNTKGVRDILKNSFQKKVYFNKEHSLKIDDLAKIEAEEAIETEGAIKIGLVGLGPNPIEGANPFTSKTPTDKKKVVVYKGTLGDKFQDKAEAGIEGDLETAVKNTSSAMAGRLSAGKSTNIKEAMAATDMTAAAGIIFEAALGSLGAPFEGQKGVFGKSIDFPLGLGKKLASRENFNIPSDIPTDATRTIGSYGKNNTKFLKQVQNFLRGDKKTFKDTGKSRFGTDKGRDKRGSQSLVRQAQLEQRENLKIPDEFFNRGGSARGISPKDTIPALLTPGEFVFNKDAVDRIGEDNLRKMNQGKVQGFNKGGFVGDRVRLARGSKKKVRGAANKEKERLKREAEREQKELAKASKGLNVVPSPQAQATAAAQAAGAPAGTTVTPVQPTPQAKQQQKQQQSQQKKQQKQQKQTTQASGKVRDELANLAKRLKAAGATTAEMIEGIRAAKGKLDKGDSVKNATRAARNRIASSRQGFQPLDPRLANARTYTPGETLIHRDYNNAKSKKESAKFPGDVQATLDSARAGGAFVNGQPPVQQGPTGFQKTGRFRDKAKAKIAERKAAGRQKALGAFQAGAGGLAFAAPALLAQLQTPGKKQNAGLAAGAGALSGAASGAAAGSVFGAPGIIIGAGLGAAASGIDSFNKAVKSNAMLELNKATKELAISFKTFELTKDDSGTQARIKRVLESSSDVTNASKNELTLFGTLANAFDEFLPGVNKNRTETLRQAGRQSSSGVIGAVGATIGDLYGGGDGEAGIRALREQEKIVNKVDTQEFLDRSAPAIGNNTAVLAHKLQEGSLTLEEATADIDSFFSSGPFKGLDAGLIKTAKEAELAAIQMAAAKSAADLAGKEFDNIGSRVNVASQALVVFESTLKTQNAAIKSISADINNGPGAGVTTLNAVNPFEAPLTKSTEEIAKNFENFARTTGIVGTQLEKDLKAGIVGSRQIEEVMKEALLGAVSGGEKLNAAQIIDNIDSSGALSSLPEQLQKIVRQNLEGALASRQSEGGTFDTERIQSFLNDGDLTGVLAPLAKKIAEQGQVFVKALATLNSQYETSLNNFIALQNKVNAAQDQVLLNTAKNALVLDKAAGNILSIDQQARPEDDQLARLQARGGANPLGGVAGITTRIAELEAEKEGIDSRRLALAGGDAQGADTIASLDALAEEERLNSEALNANNKALGLMAKSTVRLTAIQSKLAEIENRRAGAKNLVQEIAEANPLQRREIAREVDLAGRLRAGEQLQGPALAKATKRLEQIAALQSPEEAKVTRKIISDARLRAAGPVTRGLDIDLGDGQTIEGLASTDKGETSGEKELIIQMKAVFEIQRKAQQAQADYMAGKLPEVWNKTTSAFAAGVTAFETAVKLDAAERKKALEAGKIDEDGTLASKKTLKEAEGALRTAKSDTDAADARVLAAETKLDKAKKPLSRAEEARIAKLEPLTRKTASEKELTDKADAKFKEADALTEKKGGTVVQQNKRRRKIRELQEEGLDFSQKAAAKAQVRKDATNEIANIKRSKDPEAVAAAQEALYKARNQATIASQKELDAERLVVKKGNQLRDAENKAIQKRQNSSLTPTQLASQAHTPTTGVLRYDPASAPTPASPINYTDPDIFRLHLNKGGSVPGAGNTDTVNAKLTPGEFVVNKTAANRHSGLLSAINSGGVRLASGGLLGSLFNAGRKLFGFNDPEEDKSDQVQTQSSGPGQGFFASHAQSIVQNGFGRGDVYGPSGGFGARGRRNAKAKSLGLDPSTATNQDIKRAEDKKRRDEIVRRFSRQDGVSEQEAQRRANKIIPGEGPQHLGAQIDKALEEENSNSNNSRVSFNRKRLTPQEIAQKKREALIAKNEKKRTDRAATIAARKANIESLTPVDKALQGFGADEAAQRANKALGLPLEATSADRTAARIAKAGGPTAGGASRARGRRGLTPGVSTNRRTGPRFVQPESVKKRREERENGHKGLIDKIGAKFDAKVAARQAVQDRSVKGTAEATRTRNSIDNARFELRQLATFGPSKRNSDRIASIVASLEKDGQWALASKLRESQAKHAEQFQASQESSNGITIKAQQRIRARGFGSDTSLYNTPVATSRSKPEETPVFKKRRPGGRRSAYNTGGGVPGIGNTDSIPAMLTPGEFVVNKKGVQANLAVLQAMNRGKKVSGFADGSQENLPFSAPSAGGTQSEMKLDASSQTALNGFATATAQLATVVPSLDGFTQAVTTLNQAAQTLANLTIPETIEVQIAPVQVNVNINGAEALANIEEPIQDMIATQVREALGNSINPITGETQEGTI